MNQYPEFKLVTPDGKTIIQEGYTTTSDDEPILMWYTEEGFETCQIRKNKHPYESEEFKVWEETMNAFIADDQFFQFMHDFADENKTIERDGYILIINDGDDY